MDAADALKPAGIHSFDPAGATLRDHEAGESMHSTIGAWEEARSVYVDRSGLAAMASTPGAKPIVIYDLGFGIGANAIAAIEAHRSVAGGPRRALRLLSFESKLSGIELALERGARDFPFLAGHEPAIRELLSSGAYRTKDGSLDWTLHPGAFEGLDLSGLPDADVVFFDFFSPKATPSLWGEDVFARLRAKSPEGLLLTYSAATRARVAMLLGGWCVGEGERTPIKTQTTVAAASLSRLERPLGREWLEKLERSSAKAPWGYAGSEPELMERIAKLPQFS